jgi:hypothetical protein
MGANLPTMNLAWHYRSRHESLIAFFNHRYYGCGLVTFPSPVTEDRAVSFHHVAGVYEEGGACTNKLEDLLDEERRNDPALEPYFQRWSLSLCSSRISNRYKEMSATSFIFPSPTARSKELMNFNGGQTELSCNFLFNV